jgi:monoterpene epsilon-lactone hydrolase
VSKQQLDGILKMAAQNPPPTNATPDMMRRWAEGITSHMPLAENVEIKRPKIGSFEGDLILPAGRDPSRLIIYYHGGGFFLFSSRTYRVTTTNLARTTGSAVFVPDYRLAPENPAPAAHDDAFAVYQSALKLGYAPAKTALSGDSAGGNLALATAVRARDAGLPLPGSLMLLSPWLDFAEQGASYRNTPDDPILAPQVLDGFKLAYLGNGDRKSSKVTPFDADLRGLPPTLVHVGSWERLLDDSVGIVERMKAAGVAAELIILDCMCHGWQLFAPMLDEGMASIEDGAVFIKLNQRVTSAAA